MTVMGEPIPPTVSSNMKNLKDDFGYYLAGALIAASLGSFILIPILVAVWLLKAIL